MNISTTLIGLFFLLIFLCPIIYVLVKEKKERKLISKRIDDICSQHALQKTKPEIIGKTVFMIDHAQNSIIEFNKGKNDDYHLFRFKNLEHCTVEKTTMNNESNVISIASITILFITKEKTKTVITVFDDDYPNSLESEAILYQSHQLVNAINKRL
ncbi:hypothetical protein ACG2LH_03615 [Zhouia sp. PK063]|uniref:hypothetical protein n=1 Tax=Zhouia sp. PK063 TaxID=3373602 RepID=UPI0037A9ACFD